MIKLLKFKSSIMPNHDDIYRIILSGIVNDNYYEVYKYATKEQLKMGINYAAMIKEDMIQSMIVKSKPSGLVALNTPIRSGKYRNMFNRKLCEDYMQKNFKGESDHPIGNIGETLQIIHSEIKSINTT